MYINKSLTFLEQVIVALADRRREHIPFRQSKLTHCLKDSIGGRSNTLLVANVWGEKSQIEETVSIEKWIKSLDSQTQFKKKNRKYTLSGEVILFFLSLSPAEKGSTQVQEGH